MNALVCDLGGTSCRLGLANHQALAPASVRVIANDRHSGFSDLLAAYVSDVAASDVTEVVIALAAPVTGDFVELTNRDWVISKSEIRQVTGAASVHFINDFEALGHSLGLPAQLHTQSVLSGDQLPDGVRLVLGGGTGFNCAARLGSGEVVCCEAGHTTFAVETEIDERLRDRFTSEFGRCSNDRLLSGSGLVAIYREVCVLAGAPATFSGSAGIVEAGLGGSDPLALLACEEFCRMIGRAAGDLALIFLAAGGVFLTGGVTRALMPILREKNGPFHRAFIAKGRMTDLASTFPVHLILDDSAALLGCVGHLRNKTQT